MHLNAYFVLLTRRIFSEGKIRATEVNSFLAPVVPPTSQANIRRRLNISINRKVAMMQSDLAGNQRIMTFSVSNSR